jgi:hypothetical protein
MMASGILGGDQKTRVSERNASKILRVSTRRDLRPSDHGEMDGILNAARWGVMDPRNDSIASGSLPVTEAEANL